MNQSNAQPAAASASQSQPQLPLFYEVMKPIREVVPSAASDGEALSIQDRFDLFDKANPHVFEYLKARAISLKHRGINRYGMKSLFELLRWDYAIQSGREDSFKLNNNFTALYARKLMKEVPELKGFFETRIRRSE